MYLTAGKNEMLNGLAVDALSLHSSYPGTTGANEISGGGYARQSISYGAAGGEVRTGGTVNFSVPASTVAWITGWGGGVAKFIAPNGGSPKEFYADAPTDTVYCASHGYSNGQAIVFYGGTVPGGLTGGTVCYVRDATADTFKVAATSGGAAIDITSAGTGGCMVSKITVQAYASPDTHTISSSTLGLPF